MLVHMLVDSGQASIQATYHIDRTHFPITPTFIVLMFDFPSVENQHANNQRRSAGFKSVSKAITSHYKLSHLLTQTYGPILPEPILDHMHLACVKKWVTAVTSACSCVYSWHEFSPLLFHSRTSLRPIF